MNKKIFLGVSFVFIFFLFLYYINFNHKKIVLNSPKRYVYETYFGPVNSAFIIENLKYKNDLINYYETIIKHKDSNPYFKMPLKTLPQFEPVYVMGYSKDSLLVDVISLYNRGSFHGGSYFRGWVYVKTLHLNPPTKNKSGNVSE
jgi:hypothetical protein